MSSDPGDPERRSFSERGLAFMSRRSEFTRNIAKLSTGTVARTAIVFATLPIVTRLYEPKDFGDLQLLLSIVATFVPICALKYEVAMVLARDRRESEQVAALCLWIVGGFTAVLGVLTFFFGERFLGLFDAVRLQPYAGFIVLGFVAGGVLQTAHHSLVAGKKFGTLARNNVYQVGTTQGGYLALGYWQPSFLGLFASQMLGHAIAIVHALRNAPFRLKYSFAELREVAGRYRKFPFVNTPGVFLNTVAYEMPVFLLARYFDADLVGFYMLTERLLSQPTNFVGAAVAKVYLQSAAESWHTGGTALRSHFRQTASRLLMLFFPFAVVVLVAAPMATELILGAEYREVGVLMQILIFGRFLAFASSPLIATFSVVNRQEIAVVLMALSSVTRFLAMLAFSGDSHQMLGALSASIGVFAVIYLFAIDRVLTGLIEPPAETGEPG